MNLAKHRELITACLGAMSCFIIVSMSMPLIPLQAVELGASPTLVGLLVGISAFGAIFAAVPAGYFARSYGTRLPLSLASAGMGCCCLFLYLFPSLFNLFVGLTIFNLFRTVFGVSIQSHVGSLRSTGDVSANFGWYGVAIAVGQMIGPTLSGVIIDNISMRLPWLIMAVMSLVMGCLLPFLISSGRWSPTEGEEPRSSKVRLRDLMSVATFIGILSSFVIIFALGARRIFYPLFLKDLGFSASVIGLMMTVRGFVAMFARMATGTVARKFGSRIAILSICLFILAAGIGSTPLCRTAFLLVVNSVIIGVGFGMAMPLSQATVFESAPADQKGIAMGVRMTGNRLAQMSSPLLFGVSIQFGGITSAFWLAGLILFVVSIPVFLWWRKSEGQSTS
jgi:MFS family permease